MTEIAKSAGITREALYKALRPGSAPGFDWGFDTISRVCVALGVKLVVEVVVVIPGWFEVKFGMWLTRDLVVVGPTSVDEAARFGGPTPPKRG